MNLAGFVAAILVAAAAVLTVSHVVQERQRILSDCAPHIHSVPPEKWHGGNAPPVRMPKGCS